LNLNYKPKSQNFPLILPKITIKAGELKSRINRILKSFHQRRIQIQTRQIEAQIASTPSTEVDKINSLLPEKIKLRKESLTPPSLPQTET
jgi:acetolactate synthase small subunit